MSLIFYSCTFETNDSCLDWYKHLSDLLNPLKLLKDAFAFAFHAYCKDTRMLSTAQDLNTRSSLSQSG